MFAYYGGQNQAGQIVNQGAGQAAAISAASSGNMADNIGLAAMALAKGYADRQSAEAKGKAYQNFLKVAGPELGFSPELIGELSSQPAHQLGQMGDGLINQMVQHGYQMRYLDARTAARGQGTGGGGQGAGAAAGETGGAFIDL